MIDLTRSLELECIENLKENNLYDGIRAIYNDFYLFNLEKIDRVPEAFERNHVLNKNYDAKDIDIYKTGYLYLVKNNKTDEVDCNSSILYSGLYTDYIDTKQKYDHFVVADCGYLAGVSGIRIEDFERCIYSILLFNKGINVEKLKLYTAICKLWYMSYLYEQDEIDREASKELQELSNEYDLQLYPELKNLT